MKTKFCLSLLEPNMIPINTFEGDNVHIKSVAWRYNRQKTEQTFSFGFVFIKSEICRFGELGTYSYLFAILVHFTYISHIFQPLKEASQYCFSIFGWIRFSHVEKWLCVKLWILKKCLNTSSPWVSLCFCLQSRKMFLAGNSIKPDGPWYRLPCLSFSRIMIYELCGG